eukprot:8838554-Heterocapsa_arctica.AAC.1
MLPRSTWTLQLHMQAQLLNSLCTGCRLANGSTCASAPALFAYASTPGSCGSCDTASPVAVPR